MPFGTNKGVLSRSILVCGTDADTDADADADADAGTFACTTACCAEWIGGCESALPAHVQKTFKCLFKFE